MIKSIKPILYFINGTAPTAEEFNIASQFMGNGPVLDFVSLTNFDLNSPVIENSGVAGSVPENYSKFKRIDIVKAPETPAEVLSVGKDDKKAK